MQIPSKTHDSAGALPDKLRGAAATQCHFPPTWYNGVDDLPAKFVVDGLNVTDYKNG